MFRKQYKVKTSTTIRGSDRRRLRSLVETSFPDLTSEDVNNLIPNKGEMSQVKAMSHSGSLVMIYCSGTIPIFFQVEEVCYPTVYTLWKYPTLLPVVTTNPPVLEKMCNGADLMAPGVLVDESLVSEMDRLKVNGVCAVRIIGNKSPVAVGTALVSKEALCQDGLKGKAVTIIHSYKDTLWSAGGEQVIPVVLEEDVDDLTEDIKDINISDEIESNSPVDKAVNETEVMHEQPQVISEEIPEKEDKVSDVTPEYTMDEVLRHCFLTALKISGKKITLPILTSTFYSTYVLKSCPSSLNLDIKKTTYKKCSVFLKKMQKEGLLQIKELTKGVESIVSINLQNETLRIFKVDPLFKEHLETEKEKCIEEVPTASIQGNYKFPCVTELYVISAQVKVLFEKYNMRKGDTVTSATVKEVLKRYVKDNSLQNEHNPREVVLDPILSDCVAKKKDFKDIMTWEELHDAIICKMPHAYQIEFEDKDVIVKKGKLEPIQVTVDTRTGNKKVTLINNLETYGINPEKLAQHVQVAVAASTSLTPTQNGKGTLVLIQGNQVRYLQKLFLEIYKVPRKYLLGLENVPKKK